jgi:ureidoglycolate hydrolase
MKVCNLGTATHLEDIMQMSDYICTEAPLLIIVPAFDRIKRSLQEISIHLFRAEQEKASQAILHLEKHCMETVSGFLPDHGSAFELSVWLCNVFSCIWFYSDGCKYREKTESRLKKSDKLIATGHF